MWLGVGAMGTHKQRLSRQGYVSRDTPLHLHLHIKMHIHPQRKPLLAAVPRGIGLLPRDKVVLGVQFPPAPIKRLPSRGPRASLAPVVAPAVL